MSQAQRTAHERLVASRIGIRERRYKFDARGKRVSHIDANAAIEMYKQGCIQEQIAAHFKVTRQRVQQVLKKHGIRRAAGGNSKRIAAKNEARLHSKNHRCLRRWGMTIDEYRAHVSEYGTSGRRDSPMGRFQAQRKDFQKIGVVWLLPFAQWWAVWQRSGKWQQRGRGNGYRLARINTARGYVLGNVQIIGGSDHMSDTQNMRYGNPLRHVNDVYVPECA